MRNKTHIMYSHRKSVVFVSNLLSAPSAHGASQCFALSKETKRESEARIRKGSFLLLSSRFAFPLGSL